MATIEKLLTMGLPRSPDPERMLLGGKGTTPASERITWEDIRHALGMLEARQRAIVQLKATPDLVTAQELASLVHHLAAGLRDFELHRLLRIAYSAGNAPHATHDAAARAVAKAQHRKEAAVLRVALAEYQDPRTCIRCKSTGKVWDHIDGRGLVQGTCGKCEGHGWVAWSDNKRSKLVGARREDWTPRYAPGYEHVLRACTAEYRSAAEAFKTVLFGAREDREDAIEQRLQARC